MVVENMLDDLFKTVTKRFYGEEGAHAHEQPTFKCPRCQHTVLLTVFQEAGKPISCPTDGKGTAANYRRCEQLCGI